MSDGFTTSCAGNAIVLLSHERTNYPAQEPIGFRRTRNFDVRNPEPFGPVRPVNGVTSARTECFRGLHARFRYEQSDYCLFCLVIGSDLVMSAAKRGARGALAPT